MLQMRFAKSDIGVQIERIEGSVIGQHRLGHLRGGGMRHAIGRADDKAIEGVAWVEWRALEAIGVRAPEQEGGARTRGGTALLTGRQLRDR